MTRQLVRSVRPLVARDVQRVAELAGQLGYPSRTEDVASRLREMQNSGEYAVFVAEVDEDQIIGWIGTSLFRSVELDGVAQITGIVVDENSRSSGVGALLLDAAQEWARNAGSTVLCVSSNIVRTRAHRFYVNHGYEQFKVQKVFRRTL